MRSVNVAFSIACSILLARVDSAEAAVWAVVDVKVTDVSKEEAIVGLSVGEQAGVAVGDPIWILSDSGISGSGEIVLTKPESSAARVSEGFQGVVAGQLGVVLKRDSLLELRKQMPPGSTIRGKILRLPPGRRTAWMDLGESSGLRLGDQVQVSRNGVPISVGRIKITNDRLALASLEPLVSNALPEIGDKAELWPAPSDVRSRTLHTTVLGVSEAPEGTLDRFSLVIAGTAEDGLAIDRMADVYRGRDYVGTAQIVDLSKPISAAKMLEVTTATRPADGDRVAVRPPAEGPAWPLKVPVTKVDEDYCHIAAGELDGIKEGEKFLVRRQDAVDPAVWHDVASLTVEHLEPVYAGAVIKPLTSQVEGVHVWDMAERQVPPVEDWRTAGIVEHADAGARTAVASIEPSCPVKVGAVVAWTPERESTRRAAVVLHRETDRLLLYVPVGWGEPDLLQRARVEARK